jgi:hypothetical protein
MNDKTGTAETPGAFLDALGDNLKRNEGGDVALSEILETYILKAAPEQNAVAQAKQAILKLAGERANPPKPEMASG